MNYTDYLKATQTVKSIGIGVFKVIKWIIITIMKICFTVLYIISSIGAFLVSFMLPFGAYFGYTVVRQMINGTQFFESKNWGMFLFCFGVPFVFIVVKNITRPRI